MIAMAVTQRVVSGLYRDSVWLMQCSSRLQELPGVEQASAIMATETNLDLAREAGLLGEDASVEAGPNDLLLLVDAVDPAAVQAAFDEVDRILSEKPAADQGEVRAVSPKSIRMALAADAASDLALISTPGEYAASEAFKGLNLGLDTMIFSDNVELSDEIELKRLAHKRGLLVMGPDCGTAIVGGVPLGFANVVKTGDIGCVGAAGTGLQQVTTLIDRWGAGVSHVVGLGGRDLSDAVDGRMARIAVAAMRDDPDTEAILLVSKPPSERVAREVVGLAGDTRMVASLVGLKGELDLREGVEVVTTLEEGVVRTMALLGLDVPDLTEGLIGDVEDATGRISAERTLLRGLFSGGTLCYESLVILSEILGPIWSNTPLDKKYRVPAPEGSHVCLDLGEEEFTKGRPHPMIDPEARIEWLRDAGEEDQVAVLLIDVVLGYGAHADPAGELAPVCAEIMKGGGPRVVAYVLGTDQDPQDYARQRARLKEAGCTVAATNARASLAAAAIALRKPELVGKKLGK